MANDKLNVNIHVGCRTGAFPGPGPECLQQPNLFQGTDPLHRPASPPGARRQGGGGPALTTSAVLRDQGGGEIRCRHGSTPENVASCAWLSEEIEFIIGPTALHAMCGWKCRVQEGDPGRLDLEGGQSRSDLNFPGHFPAGFFECDLKSTLAPFFEMGPWS